MKLGNLYLIPAPINGTDLNNTLIKSDIDIVSQLEYFIVETPKVARSYLGSIDLSRPIQEIKMSVFDEHSNPESIQELIQPLLDGHNMGLMTDAGTPCIADPGEEIVLMCQKLGIDIIPMIGPSSIFLTLMASGLNGERFRFNGYLPKKPNQRNKTLKDLSDRVLNQNETQIFIEAPYRNQAIFESILKLDGNINLCLGISVGGQNQEITTMPISKWKERNIQLEKVPIIYIIGK